MSTCTGETLIEPHDRELIELMELIGCRLGGLGRGQVGGAGVRPQGVKMSRIPER